MSAFREGYTAVKLRRYTQYGTFEWELVIGGERTLYRVRNNQMDEAFPEWVDAPAALVDLLDTRALELVFEAEVQMDESEFDTLELAGVVRDSLMERINAYPGEIWADDHDYDYN